MSKPYIGATGFTNFTEVMDTVNHLREIGLTSESDHVPMMGFLVSYKTLNLERVENRRYPPVQHIRNLAGAAHRDAFTTIHYNSKVMLDLAGQVGKLFDMDGIYRDGICRGLQLNIPWPDEKEVDAIRQNFPDMKMIIQLSGRAMENQTYKQIAQRVASHYPTAEYILIDPSGGKGQDFDIDKSVDLYENMRDRGVRSTIGFAGGLGAYNVRDVSEDIAAKIGTRKFSIDAEGNLRDKISDKYGDDDMNVQKVKNYFSEAAKSLA